MREGHDLLEQHGRQGAAGHVVGAGIIIIAEPDRRGEIAGIAHEPGVAIFIGGAGLAGGGNARQQGAAAGAIRHHLPHHPVHIERDIARQHLRPLFQRLLGPVDHLARRGVISRAT